MDPVVHFEMPYDDRERVAKFYQAAFGWEMRALGEEMGNYVVATTAKAGIDVRHDAPKGAIGGGFFQRKPDWPGQYPSVVIAVHDLRAAMKKVNDAGGETLGEPMTIPGIGDYVSFHDTEKNRVGMLQPLMR
ncbi:MAG TPA: VOC family protein [Ramlibacter sp.]|nr:VOC family protein [Ramlibacter sp.]